jgi:hypothetical protein
MRVPDEQISMGKCLVKYDQEIEERFKLAARTQENGHESHCVCA